MRAGTAIGVLAALALAGCGGQGASTEADSPASAQEFRGQLDALCAEGQQRLLEAVDFAIPATNDQQLVMLEGLVETQEEMTPQLEALTPPADLAEGFDNYLALREERLAAAADSAESGQESPEVGVLTEEMREQAEDLGLADCAGRIDPDDEQTVTKLVVDDLRAPDPDACGTLYTPAYLKRFWPTEEPEAACRKERADLDSAKTVDVDSVTGQGKLATVSVTIDEGLDNAGYAIIALIDDGGEWKVHDEYFYSKDD